MLNDTICFMHTVTCKSSPACRWINCWFLLLLRTLYQYYAHYNQSCTFIHMWLCSKLNFTSATSRACDCSTLRAALFLRLLVSLTLAFTSMLSSPFMNKVGRKSRLFGSFDGFPLWKCLLQTRSQVAGFQFLRLIALIHNVRLREFFLLLVGIRKNLTPKHCERLFARIAQPTTTQLTGMLNNTNYSST
jgi:hypothetical protein